MLIDLKAKIWFQKQEIATHLPCPIMSELKDFELLEKQCQLEISQTLCPPDKEIVISEGKGQYLNSCSLSQKRSIKQYMEFVTTTNYDDNQLLPWKVYWGSTPGWAVQTRSSLPAVTCVAVLGFAYAKKEEGT